MDAGEALGDSMGAWCWYQGNRVLAQHQARAVAVMETRPAMDCSDVVAGIGALASGTCGDERGDTTWWQEFEMAADARISNSGCIG